MKNKKNDSLKVLILGGAGYIGSVLCKYLIERGDEVIVMDNLLYETGKKIAVPGDFRFGDIRNLSDLIESIEAADAVVNLAAISNDPASDLQPELTWEINYKSNETIAALCKATGKRIVFASSCSVYGFAKTGQFNENSKPNPVTLYARTKMLSEKFYLEENVDSIILRLATVYGYSQKPRFDLVVNTMIGTGYFQGQVIVNGGEQWRPIVHVGDVAKAIYLAVHKKNPKNRIYNVGSNDQNYKIETLGKLVAKEIPGVELVSQVNSIDSRSYKVNFDRIAKELNFQCEFKVKDAVKELYKSFKIHEIRNMKEDVYFRVKYLKKQMYRQSYQDKIVPTLSMFKVES